MMIGASEDVAIANSPFATPLVEKSMMPDTALSASVAEACSGADRRIHVTACPICDSRELHYAFSHNGYCVVRCDDCRLVLLNPQPSDSELAAIYSDAYFLDGAHATDDVSEMKAATARGYLSEIEKYRGSQRGKLLEVGCGRGELLIEARRAGYDVTGVEYSSSAVEIARQRLQAQPCPSSAEVICGELENAGLAEGTFDVCVLCDVIEHVRDPLAFLRLLRQLLKPDGSLLIATPSLASWSAKLLGNNWMEFKPEHLTYFDPATMQNALSQAGFHHVIVRKGWKVLSLSYVAEHFRRFPIPFLTPLVQHAVRFTPPSLRNHRTRVVASGMTVLASSASVDHPRRTSTR